MTEQHMIINIKQIKDMRKLFLLLGLCVGIGAMAQDPYGNYNNLKPGDSINANITNTDAISVSLSSDTVTIRDTVYVLQADTVLTTLTNVYSDALDALQNTTLNPEYSHYSGPAEVYDETNAAVDTFFVYVETIEYAWLTVQTVFNNAKVKIYRTLDVTAVAPATNGTVGSTWEDVTTELAGGAEDTGGYYSVDTKQMGYAYLFEIRITDATNSAWVYTLKH
jgi:hypothetical protein